MKLNRKLISILLSLLLAVVLVISGGESLLDILFTPDDGGYEDEGLSSGGPMPPLDEDGFYYTKEAVSRYLNEHGHLPPNFITKTEARGLGWEGGSVEQYKPGYAIGGDTFANREGLLPKADGRVYYECDIDTDGGKPRGSKRIVYSNDGLIFYTDDHYETFTQLYGGDTQ